MKVFSLNACRCTGEDDLRCSVPAKPKSQRERETKKAKKGNPIASTEPSIRAERG